MVLTLAVNQLDLCLDSSFFSNEFFMNFCLASWFFFIDLCVFFLLVALSVDQCDLVMSLKLGSVMLLAFPQDFFV